MEASWWRRFGTIHFRYKTKSCILIALYVERDDHCRWATEGQDGTCATPKEARRAIDAVLRTRGWVLAKSHDIYE